MGAVATVSVHGVTIMAAGATYPATALFADLYFEQKVDFLKMQLFHFKGTPY